MSPNYVDYEEMALRQNLDVIASLNMVGEGCPATTEDNEKISSFLTEPEKTIPYH